MLPAKESAPGITSISYNEDLSALIFATNRGFGVYSTIPFQRFCWRSFPDGGFSSAEMFGKTNILALVGGQPSPVGFSASSVVLWDDVKCSRIYEIKLQAPVTNIRCRLDTLVVVLDGKIALYRVAPDFTAITFEHAVGTLLNLGGIVALNPQGRPMVASPGPRVGTVWVLERQERAAGGPHWKGKLLEPAHKKDVQCLALNKDGSILASASRKGTLIRLWATSQTHTPTLIKELRRGTLDADILHIAFCRKSEVLCCASDSGTVHLFSLNEQDDDPQGLAFVLSQVQAGQRGFAQFDVGNRSKSIVCGIGNFSSKECEGHNLRKDRLLVVTSEGEVYNCSFDANKEKNDRCRVESFNSFSVDPEEDWAEGESFSEDDEMEDS